MMMSLDFAVADPRSRVEFRPLTLPEQLAERIYACIASGEFKPGERIREEEIASRFDVSRGPVREALRILEKDSVVSMIPNRGAFVTQLAVKEVNDIFEIRKVLNSLSVTKFLMVDDAFLAALESGATELERLSQMPNSLNEYVATSVQLGMLFASRTNNRKLAEMSLSLARQTQRYTRLGLADPNRRIESAHRWRDVVSALQARDLEQAATASAQLVERSRLEVVKQLAAGAAQPPGEEQSNSNIKTN